MRLRTKLLVVMLPVVLAGLTLQWLVSSYEQGRQWAGQHEALLTHLLDNAALRIVEERHRVLETYALENVPAYRERYETAALAELAGLAERSGTELFVLDGKGDVLLPAGLVLDKTTPLPESSAEAFVQAIGGTSYLLAARHFAPWDWTLVGGYPADARNLAIRRVNLAVTSTLLLTGFLMTVSLFVGLDRLVVRPIRLLEENARALARRRRPLDLQLAGKDELSELAAEMDAMATAIATHTAELERSNSELDHFAAAVSHDLRAPLRAIVNIAGWVEADAGPLPQAALDHLERLRDSAGRMDAMLLDLLRYARASQVAGKANPCAVRELIEAQLVLLSPAKPVTLEIDAPVATLITPEAPLALVVRNLLDNAIKHHDRGAVHLKVDVCRAERRAIFRVTDDGPGIPPAEHDRIFDIFRVRDGRSSGGSGIGLALVRRIVQRLGGTMRVESDGTTRGTTFVFDWPLDCTLLTKGLPANLVPRLAAVA